ncbi:hypothetical protein BDN70DRAFT_897055 [Pholiota conissans]|uniref:MYND-type domain-containing protein n=1 Tax=Pholiota conissans TaxID=109636 RepID=A0A9P5YZL3_9AGAR|nr:hypothetical protein BDN70DRAFT_897055 [Pholiota conissans]
MANCAICAHPAPLQCSACHRVAYCSPEHQQLAWKKHKKLCKILQKSQRGEPTPDPESYCGLCGKEDGPLRTTICCGKIICDDYDKYKMFSYSNESCSRNHDRYTSCCYHHNEGHDGDWKTCEDCEDDHEEEMRAWYGTNNCNFLDDLHPDPPSFTPKKCSQCNKMIKLNSEAYSRLPTGGILCQSCLR